ncbi:MAG: Ig-like domain-containing protein, partial [Actinomycetota bacterium]|nr:Ig-like domain-containing protein [Actinomycetota bacterium]
GSFDVTGSSSDGQSGIASYSFPGLGSGWSGSQSGATKTYDFTASAVDPSEPNNVTATNNAGLTSDPTSFTVSADGSAPATTISCDAGACLATWYPTTPVSVTLAANDGSGAGVQQIKYTTDGSDPTTSPTALVYSAAFDVTGTTTVKYSAADKVGNVESVQSKLIRIDTTAPTVSITAPADGSYIKLGAPTPYTLTADANDGGSGVASVELFQCSNTSPNCATGAWSSVGIDLVAPYDAAWVLPGNGNRALKAVATDVAGLSAANVINVNVDRTAPAVSIDDPGVNLNATVNLTGSASDADSGIDSVQFQRCDSPCGGSWTNIGAADSTAPYSVAFDTTSVSDGLYDFRAVAVDNAGNVTNAVPVALRRIDNADPNATFAFPTGGGDYRNASFNAGCAIAGFCGAASDVGSGVQTVQISIKRDSNGSYWNGSAFSGAAENFRIAAFAAGNWSLAFAAANFPADGSYTVHVRAIDTAGNVEPGQTVTFSIDNADPSAVFAFPSSGGFYTTATWNAGCATSGLCGTYSDAASGVQSVEVSIRRVGVGTYWNGSAFASVTEDFQPATRSGGTWSYAFAAAGFPTDGDYTVHVRATDNAGNVETGPSRTVTYDTLDPNTTITANPPALSNSANASFGFTSSEAGGTFECKLDAGAWALCTSPKSYTGLGDGSHTFNVRAIDRAGNVDSSPATYTWTVDNAAPTVSLDDPGANVRGPITLAASASDAGTGVDHVTFEYRPNGGGSWTALGSDSSQPYSLGVDTATDLPGDGLYDLRAVAFDGSSNSNASATRTTRVDNTSPAGSLTTPSTGATVGGPAVSLSATASDVAGSGVANVKFQYRSGIGSWNDVATDTSAPYAAAWDTTALSTGAYDLRIVITDIAGNSFSEAPVPVLVDSTPPDVALADPGSSISDTVSLSATSIAPDTAKIVFERRPAGGGAWTQIGLDTTAPYSTSFNTTGVADGLYDLRAVASDAVGNSATDVRPNVRVDNNAPQVVSATPADGSTVASASSISLTANEPLNGILVAMLDGAPAVAPTISGATASFATGGLATGPHTLAGRLEDLGGQTRYFLLHFTVWSGTAADYPYVEKNSPLATGTTVTSTDTRTRVVTPANVVADPGTGDWLVLRLDPMPAPAGLPAGFDAGGGVVDVTARWAVNGNQVHTFAQPLDIVVTTTPGAKFVPATLDNNSWRLLLRLPTAGVLPTGWTDGYYVDAAGVHMVTLHLSKFALLRDVAKPTAPVRFAGLVGSRGLTLSWAPGTDNSGAIDHFSLFVNGSRYSNYGSGKLSAGMGAFKASDTRVFTLSESDASGNESAQTKRLRALPDVNGKTEDDARKALQARGFRVGTITRRAASAPAGTVLGDSSVRLAEEGTAVALAISTGPAAAALTFEPRHPATFSWARNKVLKARLALNLQAQVTVTLKRRAKKLKTWHVSGKPGNTLLKLRLPRSARKAGRYTLTWVAEASGGQKVTKTTRLRVLKARKAKRRVHKHAAVAPLQGRSDPPAQGGGAAAPAGERSSGAAPVAPSREPAATGPKTSRKGNTSSRPHRARPRHNVTAKHALPETRPASPNRTLLVLLALAGALIGAAYYLSRIRKQPRPA